MYLQDFVFLDDTSVTTTSNPLIVNSKAETIKMSVESESTVDVTVQGKVDRESGTYFNLAVINLSDFSTAEKITAAGIYAVDAQGIKVMRVVSAGAAGSVKVMGVVVC